MQLVAKGGSWVLVAGQAGALQEVPWLAVLMQVWPLAGSDAANAGRLLVLEVGLWWPAIEAGTLDFLCLILEMNAD